MKNVRVNGIVKYFNGNLVVDGISFELNAGEFLTLLGPSGCGKTTTLRILAGLEQLDGGSVEVGGRTLASFDDRISLPPERRGMGMVFQNYAIWPHKTVYRNVAFPLEVRHVPKAEIRERVHATLETVGLSGFADRPAPNLSGGQQQRVALARALVSNPDLLLLDEPLSNLDAALREEMRFELKSLQTRLGLTTIFVTHDQSEAMALSDQVVVMNAGRIEQQDSPVEVYERPKSQFVMNFLGQVNQFSAVVALRDGEAVAVLDETDGESSLPLDPEKEWKEGTGLSLSCRMEALSLVRDDENADISGAVISSIYLGSHAEHLVQVGTAMVRVRTYPDPTITTGRTLRFSVKRQAVRAFIKADGEDAGMDPVLAAIPKGVLDVPA